jgi:DNA (cytosine-5)-methyltransferase 1
VTTNPLRWKLADLKLVKPNGRKVFTTFACGGGSSMGYKMAGFDVVAANDIDEEMARHYIANHHPRHFFRCPIVDLANGKVPLPAELMGIDLLDGSPPCSTFSMSGRREKDWGVEKRFREGQATQVLSDLFFDFLALIKELKPKIVVAENVKGITKGKAWGYTKLIMRDLAQVGYRPQLFLVNAADCGVPQRRERVFFVALRNDIPAPPLTFAPRGRRISCAEAFVDVTLTPDERRFSKKENGVANTLWQKILPGQDISHYHQKNTNEMKLFSHVKLDPSRPSGTLTARSWWTDYHWAEPRCLSLDEFRLLSSFPDDYAFESQRIGGYIMGMSVPPRMTAAVAGAIVEQWLPHLPP